MRETKAEEGRNVGVEGGEGRYEGGRGGKGRHEGGVVHMREVRTEIVTDFKTDMEVWSRGWVREI